MSACWHRWTKWGEVKAERIISARWNAEGVEYYQQRECAKCGRVQRAMVEHQ